MGQDSVWQSCVGSDKMRAAPTPKHRCTGLVPQAGFEPAWPPALTGEPPDSESGVSTDSTIGATARNPTWIRGPFLFRD